MLFHGLLVIGRYISVDKLIMLQETNVHFLYGTCVVMFYRINLSCEHKRLFSFLPGLGD